MKKYIYSLFAFFIITGMVSCKKYLDINNNPNQPTAPPINGLLGNICQGTMRNQFSASNITSYYTQYLASSNTASPTDTYDNIDASTLWSNLYNIMTDAYALNELAVQKGSPHHQGLSKILMSINLKIVHDLWGDAPFSEALNYSAYTPKFDKAEDLYSQCIKLLDDGIALLQKPAAGASLDASLDYFHNGNISKWIKTAHLLKARLLNQKSKKADYVADNVLSEINSSYTASSDDAVVTKFSVRSPWAQVAVDNANLLLDGWLSQYLVVSMRDSAYGIKDPRLPLITNLTIYGDYRGTKNGVGRGTSSGTQNRESVLTTSGWYSSTNAPFTIASFDEAKFIAAEAYFRKGFKNEAYTAYLDGIKINMDKMSVSVANRDAYLALPAVAVGSGNLTLSNIMNQKYKALFLHSETWNDMRRMDYLYPGFQMPANAVTASFVRRLVYPNIESSRNSANTPKIADITQKLWWD